MNTPFGKIKLVKVIRGFLGRNSVSDEPEHNSTLPISSDWAYEHEASNDEDIAISQNLLIGLMNVICDDDYNWEDFDPDELDSEDFEEMIEECLDNKFVIKDDIPEQTVVGRITNGDVGALTTSEVYTLLRSYAGAYSHENTTPITIEKVGIPHALHGLTQGHLSTGWTFFAGKSLSITAFANSGGTKTQVTVAGHGLVNGDVITLANTTSYDGIYNIEQVTTNTFVIQKTWVANDGAQIGHAAAYLTNTNDSATGIYLVCGVVSATPANSNDVFEFEYYLDTTELLNTESQIKLGATSDYAVATTQGIIDYTAGQRLWAKTENLSGAGDLTIRNANYTITRIG
jgi:hypothetical protein